MTAFVGASDTPHLLRVWNYLDAITFGDGDAERYREFCVGRARGLGDFDTHALPAATAIGRCDRSEEHTSELQSLMRTSYAVFCLKKKHKPQKSQAHNTI